MVTRHLFLFLESYPDEAAFEARADAPGLEAVLGQAVEEGVAVEGAGPIELFRKL